MTPQEAKAEIESLREQLNEHNYRYYVLDSPTISDRNSTNSSAIWPIWKSSTPSSTTPIRPPGG